jgi:hypothetical protein
MSLSQGASGKSQHFLRTESQPKFAPRRSNQLTESATLSAGGQLRLTETPAVVRNISDAALWAAHFRALESRRPDASFRGPFAEKLEAARGWQGKRRWSGDCLLQEKSGPDRQKGITS